METAVYGGDYCDTETFRAECARDEVVVVRSARYGRMELGRCVETEMGHIGCYRDVLTPIDRRCSGRRRCELRVPDAELESSRPCLRELKSYLEAAYSCVPGIVSSRIRPERPQFAPNDPYFSTVGGQPSVPWSDDSPFARQTSVP